MRQSTMTLVASLVIATLMSAFSASHQTDPQRTVMRQKLHYAQSVLEALVLEDFEGIEDHTSRLGQLVEDQRSYQGHPLESITANPTTASASSRLTRPTHLTMRINHRALSEAGSSRMVRVALGPTTKSCRPLKSRMTATRPSFQARALP